MIVLVFFKVSPTILNFLEKVVFTPTVSLIYAGERRNPPFIFASPSVKILPCKKTIKLHRHNQSQLLFETKNLPSFLATIALLALGGGHPLRDPRGPVLRAGALPRPHRRGALPPSGGLRRPRQGEAAGGGGGGGGLQGRLRGGNKVLPQQDAPRSLKCLIVIIVRSIRLPSLLLQNYAMQLKKQKLITETHSAKATLSATREALSSEPALSRGLTAEELSRRAGGLRLPREGAAAGGGGGGSGLQG